MGRRPKQTFLQRIHTYSHEAHEKMFNITNLEKCTSKLQWDITSHQSELLSFKKKKKKTETVNVGEGVDRR